LLDPEPEFIPTTPDGDPELRPAGKTRCNCSYRQALEEGDSIRYPNYQLQHLKDSGVTGRTKIPWGGKYLAKL
jgi:hypothetical protein